MIKSPRVLPFAIEHSPINSTQRLQLIRYNNPIETAITLQLSPEQSIQTAQLNTTPDKLWLEIASTPNNPNPIITNRHSEPDSTAGAAGLQLNDRLLEINNAPITNIKDYEEIIEQLSSTATFLINRKNKPIYIAITTH